MFHYPRKDVINSGTGNYQWHYLDQLQNCATMIFYYISDFLPTNCSIKQIAPTIVCTLPEHIITNCHQICKTCYQLITHTINSLDIYFLVVWPFVEHIVTSSWTISKGTPTFTKTVSSFFKSVLFVHC